MIQMRNVYKVKKHFYKIKGERKIIVGRVSSS